MSHQLRLRTSPACFALRIDSRRCSTHVAACMQLAHTTGRCDARPSQQGTAVEPGSGTQGPASPSPACPEHQPTSSVDSFCGAQPRQQRGRRPLPPGLGPGGSGGKGVAGLRTTHRTYRLRTSTTALDAFDLLNFTIHGQRAASSDQEVAKERVKSGLCL